MNQPYDGARYQMLTSGLDWLGSDIRVAVWGGTPDFVATDQSTADIEGRGHVMLGISETITLKQVAANGTAQTDEVLIHDVPIGETVSWLTILALAGPTDELILFIDEAVELPFDPNGLDLIITPDWLENRGWFRP